MTYGNDNGGALYSEILRDGNGNGRALRKNIYSFSKENTIREVRFSSVESESFYDRRVLRSGRHARTRNLERSPLGSYGRHEARVGGKVRNAPECSANEPDTSRRTYYRTTETKAFMRGRERLTARGRQAYRTSAVAHPDVTFDVEGRRSGEPERFHVGKHLGLEHLAFAPRSSETADQFVVDGASENDACVKCAYPTGVITRADGRI